MRESESEREREREKRERRKRERNGAKMMSQPLYELAPVVHLEVLAGLLRDLEPGRRGGAIAFVAEQHEAVQHAIGVALRDCERYRRPGPAVVDPAGLVPGHACSGARERERRLCFNSDLLWARCS